MSSSVPVVRVVSAEVQRDGAFLLAQRSAKGVLPLLWEFPGGRVREGESDEAALQRCLADRLGVGATIFERVLEVRHAYPEYCVVLAVYRAVLVNAEPTPIGVNAVAWVKPEAFGDYPFPGADQKTVDALVKAGA